MERNKWSEKKKTRSVARITITNQALVTNHLWLESGEIYFLYFSNNSFYYFSKIFFLFNSLQFLKPILTIIFLVTIIFFEKDRQTDRRTKKHVFTFTYHLDRLISSPPVGTLCFAQNHRTRETHKYQFGELQREASLSYR